MAVMNLHRKVFFLLIVFLPTQLGFHFWPSWASILGRTIDYLSPTVYFTDILIFCLLLSWFFEMKIYTLFTSFFKKVDFLVVCVFLFTSIFVISNIVFAHNVNVAAIAWMKVLEYILFGFYIYQQRITLADIVKPLAIGTSVVAVIGISQYIVQRSIGGILWFLGERAFVVDTPAIARVTLCRLFSESCELHLRAYSTFSHPNVFGGYLAVTLPLIFLETFKKTLDGKWRNVYRVVCALGIVALGVSFSRSAWIVAALSMACTLFFRQKYLKLRLPFIVVLFTITLMGFFVAPIQDESFVVRRQLNEAAISIWQQSPFVGVGLNNFLYGLSPTIRSHQVYILQPVHNIYLLLLAQLGVFGIVIVLCYIGLFFRGIRWKLQKISPLYISLFALLLLGTIDHYPLTLQQGQLLLSLIISMSLVAVRFPSAV